MYVIGQIFKMINFAQLFQIVNKRCILTIILLIVSGPLQANKVLTYLKTPDFITQQKVAAAIATQLNQALSGIIPQTLSDIPLTTFSLYDINTAYNAIYNTSKSNKSAKFIIVGPGTLGHGINAIELYKYPLGKDCVVQIASQFNRLESVSADYVTPVAQWYTDLTQGPQASLQSINASLHRYAVYQNGKQHALKPILSNCMVVDFGSKKNILKKYSNLYKNGYLQLFTIPNTKAGIADAVKLAKHINSKINNLTILAQWANCKAKDNKTIQQLQIFCAAPSFQGSIMPDPTCILGKIFSKICATLVVAQYKATAQLAVIYSKQTARPIPLHLTLVGQGSFQNPPYIMQEALKIVAQTVKNTEVTVYLHAYNLKDVKSFYKACQNISVQQITADDFININSNININHQNLKK